MLRRFWLVEGQLIKLLLKFVFLIFFEHLAVGALETEIVLVIAVLIIETSHSHGACIWRHLLSLLLYRHVHSTHVLRGY